MENKLLYHITDYRNLASILKNGALCAHSQVTANDLSYADIAHNSIQNRRSMTRVEVSPNGMLHDYVPLYFAARSPMLFTISKGNVENYSGSQSDIIYLVTRTDIIEKSGKKYVFTDGHAIMAYTEFYNDLKHLDKIDWGVMESKYWADSEEDPDRRRRRQAEFLIHTKVELELFLGIGVYNDRMKEKVENILEAHDIEMLVAVRPEFYY